MKKCGILLTFLVASLVISASNQIFFSRNEDKKGNRKPRSNRQAGKSKSLEVKIIPGDFDYKDPTA